MQERNKVEYITHSGNDLLVVNAARVSLNRHHDLFDSKTDAKIIRYMARNRHWTPFGHPHVTFRIKTSIFVANQLKRHRIGAVLNEVSRRYVDDKPTFAALQWRWQDPGRKQGSSKAVGPKVQKELEAEIDHLQQQCAALYQKLLKQGIAREQARSILPQSLHTEWYWTGSLFFFAHLCRLRIHPDAQIESREVAEKIAKTMAQLFPISWKELAAVRAEEE